MKSPRDVSWSALHSPHRRAQQAHTKTIVVVAGALLLATLCLTAGVLIGLYEVGRRRAPLFIGIQHPVSEQPTFLPIDESIVRAVPAEYQHMLHLDRPWDGELIPSHINSVYPSPVPDTKRLPFHWVIKSCPRPKLGRMLSTSLLSGLLNGLKPASISIIWCNAFRNATQLPSILYNLRHSHDINIFFMAPKLQGWRPFASALAPLYIPHLLGQANLPLLLTEDDVLFAPDANARIAESINLVRQRNSSAEAYMLTLYWGNLGKEFNELTAGFTEDDMKMPADDLRSTNSTVIQMKIKPGTLWGSQAHFYSAVMTTMLARHLEQMFLWVRNGTMASEDINSFTSKHLEDIWIMNAIDKRWRCNEPGSSCLAYIVQPSLVQHTSVASSYGPEQPIHVAARFPTRVKLPKFDAPDFW